LQQNKSGDSIAIEETGSLKLVTFRWGGQRFAGELSQDGLQVRPLRLGDRGHAVGALAVIEKGVSVSSALPSEGPTLALAAVTLEAPIPVPRRNIFCVGKNYHDHAREFASSGFDSSSTGAADAIPEVPIIFSKVPESVIAHRQAIRIPHGISEAIDYEAELAVVIGTGGTRIGSARAMDHVWGYTIINDVTARDWQHRHKQWHLGKSFDTFCPMGPALVSKDECDASNTRMRLWVNGELRQDAQTSQLIFDIPTLIETISAGITLYPGDIIATGTPVGVGIGFKPPKYLRVGDRVKIEIEGLGSLENPVQ
jgi:2-keto-4-pentenoate hydratase/2-oxohepta-3-ene-1,7-dioic acid hydratase in catechol pathway